MFKKENIVFLIFSLISISIALFATYLLSNYFTIEEFGKIQLLLTILGFLTIFYLSGFDIIVIKQIYNHNDNIIQYVLKNIMIFSLLILILCGIIVYLFFDHENELILYALMIVSIGLFDKSNAILNAKLKFKQLRYLELYSKLLLLSLAICTISFKYSIENYLILFTILTAMVLLIRILYSRSYLRVNDIKIDYRNIKKEGISTSISTTYNIIASWSERLLLGFIDTNTLAIFVIGQLFSKVLKDNIKIILTPTLSTWASEGFEHYKTMIEKYQLTLWGIGIAIYISIYFIIDVVISNYFIKYEESILIGQLLGITLVFKFVEMVKMSSMALSSHTNVFNKINNISNTVKILLVIVLIPLYGIYGAIISILIVESLRFVMLSKEYKKL